MAFDPADMSVAELRAKLQAEGLGISPQTLNRLGRDPRRGVRALYRSLKARQERERADRQRCDNLLNFERVLWRTGVCRVAGVDEVGAGPLAGPLVAAAVVFPPGTEIRGVDDSKQLDAETRQALEPEIRKQAAVGLGVADVDEIDRVNVYQAGLAAMRRAVEALPEPPEHVLVDARHIPGITMPQNVFTKGDGLNFSIAAASIVAKVYRDRLMTELDEAHPGYGFARHKGYATPEHQDAVRRLGPSPIHRTSYTYIKELCGEYSEVFYRLQAVLEEASSRDDLVAFEAALDEGRSELADEEYRKLRLTLRRRWRLS